MVQGPKVSSSSLVKSSQQKQPVNCMTANFFQKIFAVLAQCNMSVMKVAAGASYVPVTAIFSTEIQPVLKL